MTCQCGDCQPRPSRREFISKASLIASSIGIAMLGDPLPVRVNAAAIPVSQGLSIFPRSAWGSKLPPKSGLRPEQDVKFLLVHHTAANTDYKQSQVPREIQSIFRFHSGTRKWSDVCYNFFVDRFGGVWEGRAGSLAGPVEADATGGSQGFAQLVCLLGNFETNQPPQPMVEACGRILGWLAHRYEIDIDQSRTVEFISRGSNKWRAGTKVSARPISGHRDMSATACPGRFVYPLLESEIPNLAMAYQSKVAKQRP